MPAEITFEDFLQEVSPPCRDFARQTHDLLLQNDCKVKFQTAKNGYVVSYAQATTKRVVMNFVFRKSGLVVRIYGDSVGKYMDFLETLPESTVLSIEKAPVCKDCNAKCLKSYDFFLRGAQHHKCRYNGFMFAVTEESAPSIRAFLAHELEGRSA